MHRCLISFTMATASRYLSYVICRKEAKACVFQLLHNPLMQTMAFLMQTFMQLQL